MLQPRVLFRLHQPAWKQGLRVATPSQVLLHPFPRRFVTSEAGENKSGHISITPNEGIIFFNNLLPVQVSGFLANRLNPFSWFPGRGSILKDGDKNDAVGVASPTQLLQDAIKGNELGITNVEVLEVLPRLKEGGAYLKFSHDEATDAATIAEALRKHLKENPVKPWWNPFVSVRAGLVLGRPWVEDLFRMPQRRLRVEFLPVEPGAAVAELSQEQLYSFFRPYGKLADIVVQDSDSKIVPRFAYVDFAHLHRAIMAKNCLHGYTANESQGGGKLGTVIRLKYERQQSHSWIKDWLVNHPRITIPALVALITGITVAVFDPLRTFSIRVHITRAFHFEDNAVWRWFRSQSKDFLNRVRHVQQFDNDDGGMEVVWEGRKQEIEQIQSWLMETADTFIIVQGPRGSGKKELVLDHALKHKKAAHRVLYVDCKPIQEARGDAATICAAADQVGYRPVFSWMNNISGLMDLAAQGMTGVKAGFSETLENQLSKVWNNTASALKQIALDGRRKDDKDANLSDDEYLEAHPECRPIVVVDNFLHKNNETGANLVYDKLAEWAARLTTSNLAHVIFLTNDVSFSKSLSKALPDRVFRQISLGDCSPEVAKRYVINHLDFDATDLTEALKEGEETKKLTPSQKRTDLRELDDVIPLLGGRLTDLEFLARRIKTGETPLKAVREIVDQSASEILKMFLLLGGSETRDWTSAQAWTLVRSLAAQEVLRFNEVLLLDTYKSGGDKALAALEQAELISVQSLNGRPYSIKPGKPVYQSAFQRLVDDKVLSAKMDLALLGDAISGANKSIDKYEQELHLLGKLPKQPAELRSRIQWLLANVATQQSKIEGWEKESAILKKVLQSEY
ncbi:mitochondrial escape protein 2 [Acrodontium crateriforme]|uniref:Mitochondrial escape protein 2 n=1 Tax=Acrodontium crateriforme TaxID=150365 RepID=A0AAQ3R9J3_9PEZI|nr:mitochondrial escape protein 2 [Acrodontium crateriforme]